MAVASGTVAATCTEAVVDWAWRFVIVATRDGSRSPNARNALGL